MTATHGLLLTGATGAVGTAVLHAFETRPDLAAIFALTHVTPLPISSDSVTDVRGDIGANENLGMMPADAGSLADTAAPRSLSRFAPRLHGSPHRSNLECSHLERRNDHGLAQFCPRDIV